MRQVRTSSSRRPPPATPTQLSDISRLSAITTELVAIRQHLTDRSEAGKRLDDIVAGLDATITALLHAAPASAVGVAADAGHSASSPGGELTPAAGRGIDQFLAWLVDPVMPDHLAAGPEWSAEPVSHLLGRLSTSPRGLTADEATVVGMPVGTSTGNAAVALLLAVEDPAGPRCRSYRAAAYYLQDLAEPLHRQPHPARRITRRAPDRPPTTRTAA